MTSKFRAENVEPVVYVHDYTVAGSGVFPFDMLRYDSSYPIEPKPGIDGNNTSGAREVTLRHIDSSPQWRPTSLRWSSFLWVVKQHDVKKGALR